MSEKEPLGFLGLSHESGWMTGPKFLNSFQHFHGFVNCPIVKPILMTMDQHISHMDFQAITFAKEKGK